MEHIQQHRVDEHKHRVEDVNVGFVRVDFARVALKVLDDTVDAADCYQGGGGVEFPDYGAQVGLDEVGALDADVPDGEDDDVANEGDGLEDEGCFDLVMG